MTSEIENKLRSRHMLTEAQAAQVFGVSRCTLRCWRSLGRGPRYYKAGRTVKYDPADVDAYLVGKPVETLDSLTREEG